MKVDDSRYDPCCARCVWADVYYMGGFRDRLCCCYDPHRVRPTFPDRVCEHFEEEP